MSTPVCYIGGLGRSGTTLLERVLAGGLDACALGEMVHLWERGVLGDQECACGRRFSGCPFWGAVGDAAFGGWAKVDAAEVERLRAEVDRSRRIPALVVGAPAVRARSREYSGYFARIYAAALQVSGAPIALDSSKHPSTAFHLRLSPDVDLRVVQVVRDSRGVAYSWTKTLEMPGAQGTYPQLMHRYPTWRSALLWDSHNLALASLGRLGVPTRRVGYERFVRQPGAVLAEVAAFLGLPVDVGRVLEGERTVRLPATHQVAGNPMRFRTGAVQLRVDEAWRSALPRRSRATVSALTVPLLARYGYLAGRSGRAGHDAGSGS